jgi:hypothetical protein
MKSNEHDPKAIAEAIRLIVGPGQVTELRALEATTAADRYPHTAAGYFDDADKLAAAVGAIRTAKGIYFIPNQVNPALLARANNRLRKAPKGESTQDGDILRRRWLLIDVDALRPSGISATDAEHEAAIDRARDIFAFLRDQGWPDPIAADSGNGGHLLYRIDLPADDGGLVQRCLYALAERFDDEIVKIDQSVFNPARIWKLYGTIARKGDDTPDRPHRMARILSRPETITVVPVEKLEALAAEACQAEPVALASRHTPRSAVAGNLRPFDVAAFIARHNLDATGPEPWNGQQGPGRRWIFNTDPMGGGHDDGSCFIIEHATGAISAGCLHNSATWTWRDLRAKYEPEAATAKTAARPPMPVALPPVVEPYRPFPLECLPEPVRSFVKQVGTAMCCDESFVALPLLAAAAAAVGNCLQIELKKGWTEPCILWCVVVAESGTLKSPALELALRPVRNRQRLAIKEHRDAMETYEADLVQYEINMTAWKKTKDPTDSPIKPQPPVCWRNITEDTTVEALAMLLVSNWRGLLVGKDEWAGWLRSFGQYKQGRGGDEAHWLNMHGGRPMIVDRKTTGTIFVSRAAVSICGGIQPGPLARVLRPEFHENGLLARVLFAHPPRRRKRWTEAEISPAMEKTIGELFDKLYSLEPIPDDNGDPQPGILRLSPEAKTKWIRFFDAHADEQVRLSGDEAAAWSKLEGYAARLAIVVHCLRWAAGDSTLAHSGVVDDKSMEAGIALSQWFGQETRRVYATLGETDVDRDRRRLMELIRRKGGTLTSRELMRSSGTFQKAEDAEAALEELTKAGIGQWEYVPPGPKGGQPTRRFVLADRADADTTTPLPQKNEGFVNVNGVNGVDEQDADLRNAEQERKAICEIDGGLSAEDAEHVAEE